MHSLDTDVPFTHSMQGVGIGNGLTDVEVQYQYYGTSLTFSFPDRKDTCVCMHACTCKRRNP